MREVQVGSPKLRAATRRGHEGRISSHVKSCRRPPENITFAVVGLIGYIQRTGGDRLYTRLVWRAYLCIKHRC